MYTSLEMMKMIPKIQWILEAWVSQSVKLTSAQVMISWFVSSSLMSGSLLTTQSLDLAMDSVPPSLSSTPPHVLCLCLSEINKC